MNTKRKTISEGLFRAELDALFAKELARQGYAGLEVFTTPRKTNITVKATRVKEVYGEKNRRIQELQSVVEKRFGMKPGQVIICCDKIQEKGLSAEAQVESLRYRLEAGLPIRRAAYAVIRSVMEAGARGVEVIVSGKLRAQRAKSQKYRDGFLLRTGQPKIDNVDVAVRSISMRSGMIGVKVKICQPVRPSVPQPDFITIREPKE
ncbi:Ribosomal protein S3, eukaryotic/archaeal like protein [Aduncisulcus paluster]|uniref:40S ribosomal protein S3 n=1 Tax=Aduncisulcus paluster TaxID=2918883 RepID=A0ABQ5K685_9EUKA|nr:Ribosomal protein S3, eukaryotic/archaeal like protein [Aduncisulcus paluster]